MTRPHIFRNIAAILLVLTLANLAASFAALYAVRKVRDDGYAHISRIDDAIGKLADITGRLCAQRGETCYTITVATPATPPQATGSITSPSIPSN